MRSAFTTSLNLSPWSTVTQRERKQSVDGGDVTRLFMSACPDLTDKPRCCRFFMRASRCIACFPTSSSLSKYLVIINDVASGNMSATLFSLSGHEHPSLTGSFPQASLQRRQTRRHSCNPSSMTHERTLRNKSSQLSRRTPRLLSVSVTAAQWLSAVSPSSSASVTVAERCGCRLFARRRIFLRCTLSIRGETELRRRTGQNETDEQNRRAFVVGRFYLRKFHGPFVDHLDQSNSIIPLESLPNFFLACCAARTVYLRANLAFWKRTHLVFHLLETAAVRKRSF